MPRKFSGLQPPTAVAQLFSRKTWTVDEKTALVQCSGCKTAMISIPKPVTVGDAAVSIRSYDWQVTRCLGTVCPACKAKRARQQSETRLKRSAAQRAMANGQARKGARKLPPPSMMSQAPAQAKELQEPIPDTWIQAPAPAKVPQAPEMPIPPAVIKARRKLYALLEDQFIEGEDGGTYREGWSDEKIADACDLSVATVTAHRQAAFGPLKPVLEERVKTEIYAIRNEISQLAGRVDALVRKYNL